MKFIQQLLCDFKVVLDDADDVIKRLHRVFEALVLLLLSLWAIIKLVGVMST